MRVGGYVLYPTPQQRAIIEHIEGPVLVIAGPGSGKTFTLAQRITHLVVDKAVPAEQIFVATFTEKAANEIEDRIARELLSRNIVVNFDDMYIGTFHSICLRLLEDNREFTRLRKNFTVMDQFDQTYFFFQQSWTSCRFCWKRQNVTLAESVHNLRLDEQVVGGACKLRKTRQRQPPKAANAWQMAFALPAAAGAGKSA